MKTHLKHLLGLALMVLVLAGCSNPAGPETPEVNAKLTKVEFRWSTDPDIKTAGRLKTHSPSYLLNLHFDEELQLYAYSYDSNCDVSYEDALKEVFATKFYKEGEKIDLKQWTERAVYLNTVNSKLKFTDRLQFSIEATAEGGVVKNPFDEFVVGTEDITIYVFFESQKFNDFNELR